MTVTINGKEYRELRSDTDSIVVKGKRIRWNQKQQRYVIMKGSTQIYDTDDYEGAIQHVVDTTN